MVKNQNRQNTKGAALQQPAALHTAKPAKKEEHGQICGSTKQEIET